jgi:putative ABC exporter
VSDIGTMARALVYLRVTSLVGRVKSRLKRLKQPKYLAGAVVGIAYIYLVFLRRTQAPHRGPGPVGPGGSPTPELPAEAFSVFAEIGALVLLIVLIVNWVIPRRAALAFSEAEIAFLFPAPVNRRMLIHYRLLGSQLGIAFTALILTAAFRGGQSSFAGNPWFHVIGWWVILATVNLHFTGTSFVYSKLLNRSMTTRSRRTIAIGVAALVGAGLLVWLGSTMRLPAPGDFASFDSAIRYAASQLHAGPLPWLLSIPKLLIAPYVASSVPMFLLALGPALLVLILHYFWVIHTEVSFEEASLARAERRAARVKAVQRGDWRGQSTTRKAQRAPFRLGSVGRPEVAFLWKNLLSTSAFFRPRVAMILFAIVLIGSQWLGSQPALVPFRAFVGTMFLMLLAFTLLFGPMIARLDLRADLQNSDILKTYPLRGWQIVLGELLTPLAILSVVIWLCLLAIFLLLPSGQLPWLAASVRGAAAAGLAVIAPPFVAIQLLVPNAAAVIFPAWAHSAGNRAEQGIEVMGQRIIFMAGQLLITALAALPAAMMGGVLFFLVQWLAGWVLAGVIAVAAIFAVLTVEAAVGVRWVGSRFEHFDLSAELRP